MGGAWQGDWEARILALAARHGHAGVWSYLRAHPTLSVRDVANSIGDAAPVQIERLATAECLRARAMGELICDLMARQLRANLPLGWGSGDEFSHSMAIRLLPLPEPYNTVAEAMVHDLLETSPPPDGWLPTSGDDALLRDAHARALASLPDERRQTIALGRTERQPGELYMAALQPVWKVLRLGDGEAYVRKLRSVRPELRHLFAVHWCDAEVCNGGFHQFYTNPTGVLGPEAAEGFAAIGLAACAELVQRTLRFFGSPFPREQARRLQMLPSAPGQEREDFDPFVAFDDPYYDLVGSGSLALRGAGDAYAERSGLAQPEATP
jgi:hypothetical protein